MDRMMIGGLLIGYLSWLYVYFKGQKETKLIPRVAKVPCKSLGSGLFAVGFNDHTCCFIGCWYVLCAPNKEYKRLREWPVKFYNWLDSIHWMQRQNTVASKNCTYICMSWLLSLLRYAPQELTNERNATNAAIEASEAPEPTQQSFRNLFIV